ncbi:uncharacterized protein [Osmerus mordax]|uniref:uncharacterized protein isoform X2 n=1 Tax=Osmerus mordax TaxID=8014 RepID=UPI00350FF8CC
MSTSSSNTRFSTDTESRRRRVVADSLAHLWVCDPQGPPQEPPCECLPSHTPDLVETSCTVHPGLCPSKCLGSTHLRPGQLSSQDLCEEVSSRTTLRAENEVEANKLANNYRFGFRKWKSHVTERPFEVRSDVVKELYSELTVIKPHTGQLCWNLSCYFLWPFGKFIQEVGGGVGRFPDYEDVPVEVEENKDSSPILLPSPTEGPCADLTPTDLPRPYWLRASTYAWLLLAYPILALAHSLACVLAWALVFTIPVAKMNARTLRVILLMPPEAIAVSSCSPRKHPTSECRALLCCYHAVNWYYYKYTVDGINVFAANLLPLVIVALVIGYVDKDNQFASSEAKFATTICSIIPLSYYIGMGIASISAQSNFAVGALVNATFGSITEMTFYITALLRGHREGNTCLQEMVKAALTGTLLGCILFLPGICMIIGGLKHPEQRFNSRSAGVSSALLFISVGGVFAPTLFSKAYGHLLCEGCTKATGNISGPFVCRNCHYDLSENNDTLFHNHIEPLVYSVSVLLPAAYIIGLIFTLKTHSYIYDIHVEEGQCKRGAHTTCAKTNLIMNTNVQPYICHKNQVCFECFLSCSIMLSVLAVSSHQGAVVHWSRWRSFFILIVATLLMSACADLLTEHIQPILSQPNISQYFIGVTILAMVPEIPEIVNGIQFSLQNNISLSVEVGSCIAVQVCMLQIPLLVLFNVFYDVGFVLVFSDLHLGASIFAVIMVNYIFMDGKSDYLQGTALVVVYLILLALYFFAPSPAGC